MRIAVTGATGFLGGAIARRAAARGHEVVALHRDSTMPGTGAFAWRPLGEWLGGSDALDVVVHAAALRHRHGVAPEDYLRVNRDLTERVVRRAASAAAHLLHVSSIGVYGWPSTTRLPIDETFPYDPVGPYGKSKVDSEGIVTGSGADWTILQPSITYGPGDTNGMIDKMIRMIGKHAFVVPGLGGTRVQLVYIDDLARLAVDAAERRPRGERFICTYKDPIRVRDLVRRIARATGGHVAPVGPPVALLRWAARGVEALESFGAFRGAEPPLTCEKLSMISVDRAYRIDKMRSLLDDEPEVGYEDGIARTVQAGRQRFSNETGRTT
ncbi:MAG: NAD-dependent epimerase/dehydratase family protein [Polyangiaceae bacterium]